MFYYLNISKIQITSSFTITTRPHSILLSKTVKIDWFKGIYCIFVKMLYLTNLSNNKFAMLLPRQIRWQSDRLNGSKVKHFVYSQDGGRHHRGADSDWKVRGIIRPMASVASQHFFGSWGDNPPQNQQNWHRFCMRRCTIGTPRSYWLVELLIREH